MLGVASDLEPLTRSEAPQLPGEPLLSPWPAVAGRPPSGRRVCGAHRGRLPFRVLDSRLCVQATGSGPLPGSEQRFLRNTPPQVACPLAAPPQPRRLRTLCPGTAAAAPAGSCACVVAARPDTPARDGPLAGRSLLGAERASHLPCLASRPRPPSPRQPPSAPVRRDRSAPSPGTDAGVREAAEARSLLCPERTVSVGRLALKEGTRLGALRAPGGGAATALWLDRAGFKGRLGGLLASGPGPACSLPGSHFPPGSAVEPGETMHASSSSAAPRRGLRPHRPLESPGQLCGGPPPGRTPAQSDRRLGVGPRASVYEEPLAVWGHRWTGRGESSRRHRSRRWRRL